jgi:hypothetical protein
MLEAGGFSTLFIFANRVSLSQEYLQSESILQWQNHSVYEKYPLQTKWTDTCIL